MSIMQMLPFELSVSDSLQIIVSVLVAGLYYLTLRTQRRQVDIQETQNRIMRWQTRLMAAQYEPDVVINDFSADGNTVEATLSNVGQGRATSLRLQCLMYYENGVQYSTAFSNQVLGFIISPKNLPLSRLGMAVPTVGNQAAIETRTENDSLVSALGPEEEKIVFHTDVELEIESRTPVMDVSFTSAVEQMIEKWDVEAIGLDFYLSYQDTVDQRFSTRILSIKEIPAEKNLDLASALEKGEEIDEAVSTLVPDSGKPEEIRIVEQTN